MKASEKNENPAGTEKTGSPPYFYENEGYIDMGMGGEGGFHGNERSIS